MRFRASLNDSRASSETHPNVLQVPANLFDIYASIKRHPATSEKPEAHKNKTTIKISIVVVM